MKVMRARSKKANMDPMKTEKALNREDKVMTAICVLSPSSARATSTSEAISGVKFMGKRETIRLY